MHSKYVRGCAFFAEPVAPVNSTSTKQKVIFTPAESACPYFVRRDRELRDGGLVPVVVLGVEECDAGRLGRDDVAVRVEELLRRDRALVVVDAVDVARRDLAAAADLEVPRADVDVHRGEPQPLALLRVLHLEMRRHLLDHVGEKGSGVLRRREGHRHAGHDERHESGQTESNDSAHDSPLISTTAAARGGCPRSSRAAVPGVKRPGGASEEADARTRTADPFITSEVLYQLSYVGEDGQV